MSGPNLDFWQRRFDSANTPWDRGAPGPHLKTWLEGGMLPAGSRVAVPGCGSGHDVLALADAGLIVTGIDYAPGAIALSQQRLDAAGARATLVQADVLAWQPETPFDAVYEQTCWCALHPDHWVSYAHRLHQWVSPGGRLLLLAMQCLRAGASEGRIEGPPYHLDIHMARALLPLADWDWPAPPYATVPHPRGWFELAIALTRR